MARRSDERLTWLENALRYQRTREPDLIYDAYYDGFDVDIADGNRRPPSGKD